MENAGFGQLVDRSTAPFDALRSWALSAGLRTPLRWVLARRDRRLAALSTLHVAVAFPLAVLAPSLLLVVGPLLLGVPHVAADVRYLVLRRRLPSWWKRAIWLGCGGLLGIRLLEELLPTGGWPAGVEVVVAAVWILVGALAGARSGSGTRLAIVAGVVGLATVVSLLEPERCRLALVHGHNVVAIGLWAWLFGARSRLVLVPLSIIALGALVLGSGSMALATLHRGVPDVFGLHVLLAADWLAPGLAVRPAIGLTSAFAFLQAVHYFVWLALIPQSDMNAQGSATFRMTVRSLGRDFGSTALGLVVVAALAVAATALLHPLWARATFLSLASFHVYFELAMVAFFFTRGRGLGETAEARA